MRGIVETSCRWPTRWRATRSHDIDPRPGAANVGTDKDSERRVRIVRTDGLKLIFEDGSWVCYRLSGTEPVVRAYTEARNERGMEALKIAAERFVLS